jgi:chemotaxis protein histidine kinase CheA
MKNAQKQLNRSPLEKQNPHHQTALLNLFLNDEQMVTTSHEMAMPIVDPILKPHGKYYVIETKTPSTPNKPGAGLLREFISDSRILIDNTQEIITSLKQKPDDLHSVITVWRTFQMIGDPSGVFGFRQLAELCRYTILLLNRVLNRNIRYSQKCEIIITQAYKILKKDHFHHIQDALGGQPFSGSPLCEKLIRILKQTTKGDQQHLAPLPHENSNFEHNKEPGITVQSEQPSRYSFKMFIQDNRLLTAQTEVALLFLKHNPGNTAAINTVFRSFHLIGTKAALFKFDYATELCHHTAVLLGCIRDGENDYAGRNPDLIVRAFTVLKKEIFLYSQNMLGGEPFAGSPNCLNMTHILKTLGF